MPGSTVGRQSQGAKKPKDAFLKTYFIKGSFSIEMMMILSFPRRNGFTQHPRHWNFSRSVAVETKEEALVFRV